MLSRLCWPLCIWLTQARVSPFCRLLEPFSLLLVKLISAIDLEPIGVTLLALIPTRLPVVSGGPLVQPIGGMLMEPIGTMRIAPTCARLLKRMSCGIRNLTVRHVV